jgi:hypothetical protein
MHSNKYPFVCSVCERFYSSQEGLLHHKRCLLCRTYFECANCIYAKMNKDGIADLVHLPEKLGIFMDEFKLWHFDIDDFHMPKFGLLTSRKMKRPELHFFQTIIFKYDAYMVQILDGEKIGDDARVDIIEKVVGNSTKKWKAVAEKYIIYEWKEIRAFNKTITPIEMEEAMEEEKKRREQEAKARKEEKEKRRLQLEAKRKERDGD